MNSGICKLFSCINKEATLRKLVEHPDEEGSRQNVLAKIRSFMAPGLPDSHPTSDSGVL